jgi:hypothetical protein
MYNVTRETIKNLSEPSAFLCKFPCSLLISDAFSRLTSDSSKRYLFIKQLNACALVALIALISIFALCFKPLNKSRAEN